MSLLQSVSDDIHRAASFLVEALSIRERYMRMSRQSFPTTTSRFLHSVDEGYCHNDIVHEDKKTIEGIISQTNVSRIRTIDLFKQE